MHFVQCVDSGTKWYSTQIRKYWLFYHRVLLCLWHQYLHTYNAMMPEYLFENFISLRTAGCSRLFVVLKLWMNNHTKLCQRNRNPFIASIVKLFLSSVHCVFKENIETSTVTVNAEKEKWYFKQLRMLCSLVFWKYTHTRARARAHTHTHTHTHTLKIIVILSTYNKGPYVKWLSKTFHLFIIPYHMPVS